MNLVVRAAFATFIFGLLIIFISQALLKELSDPSYRPANYDALSLSAAPPPVVSPKR